MKWASQVTRSWQRQTSYKLRLKGGLKQWHKMKCSRLSEYWDMSHAHRGGCMKIKKKITTILRYISKSSHYTFNSTKQSISSGECRLNVNWNIGQNRWQSYICVNFFGILIFCQTEWVLGVLSNRAAKSVHFSQIVNTMFMFRKRNY